MIDAQELVTKAKTGVITPEELNSAASRLANQDTTADPYDLLYIVGRGFGYKHEGLVASFLNCRQDPMLARLALQILCDFWNKADAYIEDIRRFIQKEDWDDEIVRPMAVSVAGEYLRSHSAPDVAFALWTIAHDGDEEITQEVAVGALARALGDEWSQFPPSSQQGADSKWAQDVLRRTREKFKIA